MELEFDKEMDAILRTAREDRLAPGATGAHLDADTIAAFAENALPQATKRSFMGHFADCDACRLKLSPAMSMNSEPVPAPTSVVSSAAVAAVPWYQKLFRAPGLAFAMGGLVLVFSGVLAFLVVQNNDGGNAIVSQRADDEPSTGGLFSAPAANSAANSAPQNSTSAQRNTNAPTTEATPGDSVNTEKKERTDPKGNSPVTRDESSLGLDGTATQPSKPVAAPPPPPESDVTTREVEEKNDDDKGGGQPKDTELSKRKMSEDGRRRDSPPPAAKSGPSRSGPLQNQTNQQNSNLYEMTVTRSVGGKQFSNRDGVWYDSAYRGQATTNYRRSSTDYKSLDSGLRSIADKLGGTVIVVWKSKAYRIN